MTPGVVDALAARPYPGRVCLTGRTGDGTLFWAYALTGRSTASRARILVESSNGDVKVRDARGGVAPDALRHYVALARRADWLVVGNGDHVVPLCDSLARGVSIGDASAVPTFEPDPPIYTPRIWLAVRTGSDVTSLGWVRRAADGHGHRGIVAVEELEPGFGVLLTTYDGSATEVRTSAVPTEISVAAWDIGALEQELWGALPADLRIASLVTSLRETRLLTGT